MNLNIIDELLWDYLALFVLLIVGLYLTITSNFFQFKTLWNITNLQYIDKNTNKKQGINPLKLFFASAGGMVGLGNITNITDVLHSAGPGVMLWMVIGSIVGMILKYSEIYLGVIHRQYDEKTKEYYGGPFNLIFDAFQTKILSFIFFILFSIYSVEIYQFNTVIDQFDKIIPLNKKILIVLFLILIFASGMRKTNIVVNICSLIMPIMIVSYTLFFLYIVIQYYTLIPTLLYESIYYAFNPNPMIVGLSGAGIMFTIHKAISGIVYSGDIGIGYDSSIQSNTTFNAHAQGKMAIISLLVDSIICIQTTFIVYLTGYWKKTNFNTTNDMVEDLMYNHMMYGKYFYTLLVFISAFTTIICFINVGKKLAYQVGGEKLELLYKISAILIFIVFSFYSIETTRIIMSISGGLLVVLNILTVLKLSNEIKFR